MSDAIEGDDDIDAFDVFDACGLSRTTAEDVARRCCGSLARVRDVRVEPIAHRVIRETTARLDRVLFAFRGPDVARTERAGVVVKRLRGDSPETDPHRASFLPSETPAHPNYWRREYDAYGARVLATLPPPLRAPVCYAREIGARAATLWLEDVPAAPPATWSDERFAAIARALGVWHATTGSGPAPLPAWFARGSLRTWAPAPDAAPFAALSHADVWTTGRARDAFGTHARQRLRGLRDERDAMVARLEAGPQTLAHNDLWTRNVHASPNSADVVLIDWSELGIGSLAHDLVNLVFDSVWMLDVPFDRLASIERSVLDAYADGLGDARAHLVVAAFRANALLRFGALAGNVLVQAADDAKRDEIAQRYERPFDEVFAARAAVASRALGFFESVKS